MNLKKTSAKKTSAKKSKKNNKPKKIKVALSGASGRMGQAVKDLIALKHSGFLLSAEIPLSKGTKKVSPSFGSWDPKKINAVIDFSGPKLFSKTLKWCLLNKKAFVSGTTALSPSQKKSLKQAGKKIPVFYEENMSWGIWQIKKWIQTLSDEVPNILLQDIHHKNKKDKPSGTALKLKNHLSLKLKRKLKIKSIRKGDEFGTHRFLFTGSNEQVLLEHRALSRHLFAGGALKALKWLLKKPAGLYSFEDFYK